MPDSAYITALNQSSTQNDGPDLGVEDELFSDYAADADAWDSVTRRRFYDDLTAIDWIFEYTKEKLRLKRLSAKGGLTGYLASVLDSSQVWIVLILTGLAAGFLAAVIDIIANWLGDLKDGYCRPALYLSRNFCCWGLEGNPMVRSWTTYPY